MKLTPRQRRDLQEDLMALALLFVVIPLLAAVVQYLF